MREEEAQKIRDKIESLQADERIGHELVRAVREVGEGFRKALPKVDLGMSRKDQIEHLQDLLAEAAVAEPLAEPHDETTSTHEPVSIPHQDQRQSAVEEKPTAGPATTATETKPPGFSASLDFRTVWLNGERFSLTSREAELIEILSPTQDPNAADVTAQYILNRMGYQGTKRVRDVFSKGRRGIYKALIRKGERIDAFRLNI